MISLSELNPHNYRTDEGIDANLSILLNKLNQIRTKYGIPMIVTSGLRSQAQQDGLIAAGKSNAPKSHHLTGEAADVLDSDGALKSWVMANLSFIEDVGLWMEDFSSTPNWVHFQIVPPRSGKRFFIP